MAVLIRGHHPRTQATASLAAALFSGGCVLALLEWRLPTLDPSGSGINFTRLAPLVILVVLAPVALVLCHRRHPWPSWLPPVSVEAAAGLLGYVVLFHILPRSEPPAAGPWGSWPVTVLAVAALWLAAAGMAALGITTVHLFRRPRIEGACRRCGYPLLGLREERCPECGRPLTGDPEGAAPADSPTRSCAGRRSRS